MRGRSFVLLGAVASLVGTGSLASGCDSRSKPPQRLAVVRESCAASWVPTGRTFVGFRDWRATSVHIGPITLMGAKTAAHRDVARYGQIKFMTLVRPRTPVTVEIAPAARSAVGFVSTRDASRSTWPKRGAPILRLAPCRADFLPYRGIVKIGYGMFLRVRHNACVPLTVGRTRRTVSIGAGRC